MAVGILEVESTDASSGFVARGDCLGSGGSMADFVSAQLLVGLVHVADDDGDVLKRKIVTAPNRREWVCPQERDTASARLSHRRASCARRACANRRRPA